MPKARKHPDYVDPRVVDDVGSRWNWFESEPVVLPVVEFISLPNETRASLIQVPMMCHRHPNGGGWVSDIAHVAPSVRVDPAGFVAGSAFLSGETEVLNYNGVFGGARLFGKAKWGSNRGFYKLYNQGQVFGEVVCTGDGGEGEVLPEAIDGARAYGQIQILGGAGIAEGANKGDVFGNYKALEDPEYADTQYGTRYQHHTDFDPIRRTNTLDLASGEHDIIWNDKVDNLWRHIHELNRRDGFQPTAY